MFEYETLRWTLHTNPLKPEEKTIGMIASSVRKR